MSKLFITIPSDTESSISIRRNFVVQGTISGKVPDDSRFIVELFDSNNNLVRHVHTETKNNTNVFTKYLFLTKCPRNEDPNDEKLIAFGFPELIVEDINNPLASLKNATIKCFFNDNCFKAIIVSATDILHGLEFEDGMGYLDEFGNPYEYLKKGEYKLRCSLIDSRDKVIASDVKYIKIEEKKNSIIYRYSPKEHRERMYEWAKETGYCASSDLLPGYLDQYTDSWNYHMGLLKMYRANDIAAYKYSKNHMFVYLIEEDSTSYKCELAYLQKNKLVADPNRFTAYHYDIGEAKLKETEGKIVEFKNNIEIYRIDEVNDLAKENFFNLNEESLIDSHFTDYEVHTNQIAIAGAIKPLQLNPQDFSLTYDNTYDITNKPTKIVYTIDDGIGIIKEERTFGLERFLDKSLGSSVLEFYNVLKIRTDVKITIKVYDSYGDEMDYHSEFVVHFTKIEAPITPDSDNEAL